MPEPGVPLASLLPSWELSLGDRDLSPKTIEVYMRTGHQFADWLAASGLPCGTEEISGEHIRAFLGAEIDRTSAVSAHQHFRNLRVLFKWIIREGERESPNPMLRVDPPKTARRLKPILEESELVALLKTCEGNGFEERRDMAIIRVFIDSGVRVSGLANVKTADVSLSHKQIRVVLKGRDEHLVPIGRKATAAIDRYLRARARHRHADSDWLWLGMAGRNPQHFGAAGIQDMLERRGKDAGIGKITPHYFRRTFAHDWLNAGGNPMDGMRVAGWKTTAMIEHYAGDLAAERARSAHARLSPGDRI